LRDQIASMLKA